MTRDLADLILDLTTRVQAALDEADEAKADAAAVREQRNMLLQQLHEADRECKRQRERIAGLCDENRRLRTEREAWLKAAA